MDILYIVMPAYNEEENIKNVIESWYPVLSGKNEKSRIVIADSGSLDMTHAILDGMKEAFPQLEILSDTDKLHGPKLIALYRYALKNGADFIFQTDSDGQTNPAEFEEFWQMRNEYEAIIGCRFIRGDGKVRAFVERVVCLLLFIIFKVNIPDANAPFRLYNKKILEKYIFRLPSDYNLPNIMLTTFLVYYNEKHMFKEISFKCRQGGKNSINIFKIINIGWNALGDFIKFRREMRRENA